MMVPFIELGKPTHTSSFRDDRHLQMIHALMKGRYINRV